ncbi:serine acetyltransferase [Marivirga sp. S37H4]|uniref:Serine acetyltransferase n=1 Tax=Marivirga aurantiaca TaxID=2802615 RepID=A0A934X0N9_9BACT|nr:serine O-acetyltransferase EpsC [Marivirga aurantiaca]MBK6266302.1 serine acetyltransferase [Marivirga aurantiaca]
MKESFLEQLLAEHKNSLDCPSPDKITAFYESLVSFLFPDYGNEKITNKESLETKYELLQQEWMTILNQRCKRMQNPAKENASALFNKLENIKIQLEKDVDAMFSGDPAAKSRIEVVKTYPGFKAIAAHRIAHQIYENGFQLIARVISEYAHEKTGVDIHPGAKIGDYFCIDHGTGIVIGETTEIGEYVKIYQGVTLGATSVKKEDASTKRHPTIGNHVVIYANATILGGNTIIGEKCIIGGNSWITKSVPPHTKLYYDSKNKHLEERPVK